MAKGAVKELDRRGRNYTAVVVGSEAYAVELRFPDGVRPDGRLRSRCSCPGWRSWGECKHEYAALLAVLEFDAVAPDAHGVEHSLDPSPFLPPTPLDATRRLAELGRLWTRDEDDRSEPESHGEALVLGLRLELPSGGLDSAVRLRPVVARRVELDADSASAVDAVDSGAGADASVWRPFTFRDVAYLDDESRGVHDLVDLALDAEAGLVREMRPGSGLLDALRIEDDALSKIVALLPAAAGLRRPTRNPRTHGPSPQLVVEERPFSFGIHLSSVGGAQRLSAVLRRGDDEFALVGTDSSGTPGVLEPTDASRASAPSARLVSFGWLLLDGGRLAPIEAGRGALVWQHFATHDSFDLTGADEERAALFALAETVGAHLTGVDLPPLEPCEPQPLLRIDATPHWWPDSKLPCSIVFRYGSREVRVSDRERSTIVANEVRYERAFDAERRLSEQAFALGLEPPASYMAEDDCDAWTATRSLSATVRAFMDAGWTVEAEGHALRPHSESVARVSSGVDWFGVGGEVRFDGATVPLPEVLRAARSGASWVQLGDGSRGMLPEDWLERWRWLELGRVGGGDGGEDGTVRFDRQQGWLIDALLSARGPVDADAGFRRFVERLESFEAIEPKDPPASFEGELREYQREGLGWFAYLERLGVGGCLADDMGLGKTVQVLAWLEARRRRRPKKGEERRPSLVVVPRSLLFNWKDEAARFTPRMRVALHHGPQRKRAIEATFSADLVVTTYGTLRRDAALFEDEVFDAVVLDEAQAIKNERSQASKAVRLLDARQRVALSGTPVENRIDELWALFEFLNPGMLGTVPAFKRLLGGAAFETGSVADEDDPEERRRATVRAIGRAIRPFFLRRTKAEVLTDLPEKTEQVVQVELPTKQRKAYEEAAAFYRAQLLGAEAVDADDASAMPDTMSVLTALLRLRQLACHPGLVDPDRTMEPSGKLDELIPMLTEIVAEGHKAVVFSQFTTLLELVAQRLEHEDIAYEELTGRTRDRKARVERFQNDPGVPLFLISLKAGGTGLNLTAADFVFLLDPWWNPAAEAQAIDRAHRIGRTRPVHAYRLVARDTIESRVLELQESKRDLAASLMEGAASHTSQISRADLRLLLER